MMVGDWPDRDIKGAKLVGMKTAFAKYGSTENVKDSGADLFGSDNLIIDIVSGKIHFDKIVAPPAMMQKMAIL